MPYISQKQRKILNKHIDGLARCINTNSHSGLAGFINYAIADLIRQLILEQGCSYAILNELLGALECCKLELYRRLAAPYEDQKMKENGDVFE